MYSFIRNKLRVNFYKITIALIGTLENVSSQHNSDYISCDNDCLVSSTQKSMSATREMVDQLIGSDQIVIFSKTRCPYCKMAKQVFDSLKKKYTAIELDERDDADEIQSILGEITGARTVPRVFVKGECLGGGTDVKKLYDSGELQNKF